MASHRLLTPPENPSNFLVIIPSDNTDDSTGIEIPEKFSEKHGKDLLEKVILKVPNGDVWQIDLEKSNDRMWLLKNGWGEFAKHYGMKFGYLLVFLYEGFSMFSVTILGPNASEIVYPYNTNQDNATNASVSSDEEVEIIELEDNDTCSSESKESEDDDYDEGENSRQRRRMEDKNAREELEKANANFKCHKPYFMVYMHRSYFTIRGMVVPSECRSKLLRGKNSCSWSLQVEKDGEQKTWEVVACNANMGKADWVMFLEDNGVRVGDVIAFKLINKRQNVLGVTIIRSDC